MNYMCVIYFVLMLCKCSLRLWFWKPKIQILKNVKYTNLLNDLITWKCCTNSYTEEYNRYSCFHLFPTEKKVCTQICELLIYAFVSLVFMIYIFEFNLKILYHRKNLGNSLIKKWWCSSNVRDTFVTTTVKLNAQPVSLILFYILIWECKPISFT